MCSTAWNRVVSLLISCSRTSCYARAAVPYVSNILHMLTTPFRAVLHRPIVAGLHSHLKRLSGEDMKELRRNAGPTLQTQSHRIEFCLVSSPRHHYPGLPPNPKPRNLTSMRLALTRAHDAHDLHEVPVVGLAAGVHLHRVPGRLDHVHRRPHLVPARVSMRMRRGIDTAATSHKVWTCIRDRVHA